MSAQPWKLYNLAKKKIGNATINLAATTFRIALYRPGASAGVRQWASAVKGVYNSIITLQVANGNGYVTSGQALTGEVWTTYPSAMSYMFDVTDPIWTATGGAINSIMGAAIFVSAAGTVNRHLLVRASLTTGGFNLGINNTLTLQMNISGVFTMA